MKVSIIIPCYNNAEDLPKCIESVLNQTVTDFELLLLNDGSTDATLAICDDFQKNDVRIKVYSHENKGVSYTRNRGIDLAQADYIMFIDGDDYVKPDYLVQIIKNTCDKIWTISGMVIEENNNLIESLDFKKLLTVYPEKQIEKNNFIDLLRYYCFSSPCAKIYSTKIIRKHVIQFDENYTYQEDILFNLNYAKHIDKILLINCFGYVYVNHKISASGRFHLNFNHIEYLYMQLNTFVKSKNDTFLVQEFILQTCLRKISNVFHTHARTSKTEQLSELNELFASAYYNFCYDAVRNLQINGVLKKILKLKKPIFVYWYYKISIIKKRLITK